MSFWGIRIRERDVIPFRGHAGFASGERGVNGGRLRGCGKGPAGSAGAPRCGGPSGCAFRHGGQYGRSTSPARSPKRAPHEGPTAYEKRTVSPWSAALHAPKGRGRSARPLRSGRPRQAAGVEPRRPLPPMDSPEFARTTLAQAAGQCAAFSRKPIAGTCPRSPRGGGGAGVTETGDRAPTRRWKDLLGGCVSLPAGSSYSGEH